MLFKKISVVGLGYIGLPTAATFASYNKCVVGVDIDKKKVRAVNKGSVDISEKDLEASVYSSVKCGLLTAKTNPEIADAFIISVPTPLVYNEDKSAPEADLSHIESSLNLIAPVLREKNLVILESTSPVGTTENVSKKLAELRPDLTFPHKKGEASDIRIAYCPERVLPGKIMSEIVENDRVFGGITPKCAELAVELYKTFVTGSCITTDARTAELVKLAENSCRDAQIAFANELSMICEKFEIDVWELISIANRHPRIDILEPGPGVGGHCIAVDPWFIVDSVPDQALLIRTAREVNNAKTEFATEKIKAKIFDYLNDHPEKNPNEIIVACYGLSFKADIADLRESPAAKITLAVSEMHLGKTFAVEPHVEKLPKDYSAKIELVNMEQAFKRADIHVLLVNHSVFKNQKPRLKYLVDFKGLWINRE